MAITAIDLESEVAYLATVLGVHEKAVEKARGLAEMLAAEAALTTDEGIRDLVDEDAEVDAAIRAAEVRQASIRAIYAAQRLRQLESLGSTLAFGKITDESGDETYVGRHSVIDGDDALLVDWRARAAIPFYRATYSEPLGVAHRRNFLYDEDSEERIPLVDYSDELLGSGEAHSNLRGEAAVLATLQSSTSEHMSSVVSTIQEEQDRVIRAEAHQPLVVQGGPGTGKTVVALHRAAYLLYHYRVDLEDVGILVVGPTAEFLKYISRVIPSLGESGVVSVTPDKLYPGIRVGRQEPIDVARLKGSIKMVELLRAYVELRQIRPVDDLVTWYGSSKVKISGDRLREIYDRAKNIVVHNEAAAFFKASVIAEFVDQLYSASFDNKDELKAFFRADSQVRELCLKHWPTLSPEQALNDLLGSKSILKSVASSVGLPSNSAELLHRERMPEAQLDSISWSSADVALLDELAFLVEGLVGDIESQRQTERDRLDAIDLAAQVDEDSKEVDLEGYDLVEDELDPLDPTGFWKSADADMELFPIMYDDAEANMRPLGGDDG